MQLDQLQLPAVVGEVPTTAGSHKLNFDQTRPPITAAAVFLRFLF